MDRTTVVLESVENYYEIIGKMQKDFDLSVKAQTTNGMLMEDKGKHQEIKITGRIDDDEETTTIAIECNDKGISNNIEQWVRQNYS